MKRWLHPTAEAELAEAAEFYREHASSVIAGAFVDAFESTVGLIATNPELGRRHKSLLRTFPLPRFPYSIVYFVDSGELLIFAVYHQHRLPNSLESRRR